MAPRLESSLCLVVTYYHDCKSSTAAVESSEVRNVHSAIGLPVSSGFMKKRATRPAYIPFAWRRGKIALPSGAVD